MLTRSSSITSTNSNNNGITMKNDYDAVSVCSKASVATNEEEDENLIDEKTEDSFMLPESDQSYHRRIFVMKCM